MQSNKFIDVTKDDFWTVLRDGTAISSSNKPKPYKNFRRMTMEEDTIYSCREHTTILLFDTRKSQEQRTKELVQSMANFVCEDFPDLAKKHNLQIDHTHEYWRK